MSHGAGLDLSLASEPDGEGPEASNIALPVPKRDVEHHILLLDPWSDRPGAKAKETTKQGLLPLRLPRLTRQRDLAATIQPAPCATRQASMGRDLLASLARIP